jgi:two-component system NtrC family response regulator
MSDRNTLQQIVRTSPLIVVDDDADALESLMRSLRAAGFSGEIRGCSSAEEALKYFELIKPGVVVLDLSLTQAEGVESGFRLLTSLRSLDSTTRCIVLTGHGSLDHGVRALNAGASSFLEKPADIKHLAALIHDHLQQSYYQRQYQLLRSKESSQAATTLIAGSSDVTKKLREEVEFLAHTPQPVFITGETGVGKSHLARIIHTLSKRSHFPFLTFAPTVGQLDLAMSELFGHKKGSFTGATEDRQGLFHLVGEGTLFFDEVDELPNDVQVALLRVIQDRAYRTRGAKDESVSKARLIFASNRIPEEAIAAGKLRADLYHRAAHLQIHLPALREHKADIPALVDYFIHRINEREQFSVIGMHDDAMLLLMRSDFPGNVRELEACVETACFRAEYQSKKIILAEHLRLKTGSAKDHEKTDFRSLVDAYQLRLIEEALAKNGGNQARAAQDLHLDRSTMRRILSRFGR